MAYYLKHIYGRELSDAREFDNTQCIQITKDLFLKEKMADIFFLFNVDEEEVRIPAHKLILAGGSDVFELMFYGNLQEKGDVKIVDASIESFREFLQFFYLDKIKLSIENIRDVLYLAKKYLLPERILIVCDEFLKYLPINDVCFTYVLALDFDRSELVKFCEQEIRKYAEEMFESDGFLDCSRDVLHRILEMNYFDCHEIKVFEGCINWAKHACQKSNVDASQMDNLRKQLGDCFRLIQFGLMNSETICECVVSYRGLFEKYEMVELFEITMSKEDTILNIFDRKTRKMCCDIEYETTPNFPNRNDTDEDDSQDSSLSISDVLKNQEVTKFCANQEAVLYAIETSYIDIHEDANDLSAVVTIIDKRSNVILLEQKVEFFLNKYPDGSEIYNYIRLSKAITIRKFTPYEIRFQFNSLGRECESLPTSPHPTEDPMDLFNIKDFEVQADGGIIYIFHFNQEKINCLRG